MSDPQAQEGGPEGPPSQPPHIRAAVTDCFLQGSPTGVDNPCNPLLPPHHLQLKYLMRHLSQHG